jgi:hypothetical protein
MRRLLPVLMVLVAAGAGGDGDEPADTTTTSAPTTTATSTTTTSTAPTTTTTVVAAPGTCPPPPPRAQPPDRRPQYTLRVDVRPAENAVVGTVDVRFTPDLDVDRLVFRLWPNGPRLRNAGARLDITAVRVDGKPVQWQVPDLTTLEVPAAVEAGRSVSTSIEWRLTLPGATQDRVSRIGDAVRLGSFFPILAWEPGVGWAREPPTTGFAEASVAATADFTATVTVPDGLAVLATGVRQADGTWRASAVPDFGLSVGRFTTATATTGGTQVTVGVHAGIRETPGPYLQRVVTSLEDLAQIGRAHV